MLKRPLLPQGHHAYKTALAALSITAAASLVACAPPSQPTGSALPGAQPGAQPPSNAPQVTASQSPGKARSLQIVFKLDPNLEKNFRTQQDLSGCAQELSNVETTLTLPTILNSATQLSFVEQGITVTNSNGKTTLFFKHNVGQSSVGRLSSGYTFEDLPSGLAQGRTVFKNAAGTEFGFIKYTASISNSGTTQIVIELRSNGEESALPACPELMTIFGGGVMTETGGGVSAYVPPTATPSASGSASANPSGSPTPRPNPSVSARPTPVPMPTPGAAAGLPELHSISALTGAPLDTITFTGVNFTNTRSVKFAGIDAFTYTVVNDTEMTAQVPIGFTSGKITVNNSMGTATSSDNFVLNHPATGPRTIYVRSGANGDGSSWANAYGKLHLALYLAQAGDEIWVAAGTYTPTDTTDRRFSFKLRSNIAIYGGFAGTESDKSQASPATNLTVLSGDLSGNDNYTDTSEADLSENSLHVVTASTGTLGAKLEGLTIQGGNANSSTPHDKGGGMMIEAASVTLTNVKLIENRAYGNGAGMFHGAGSSALMNNVSFNTNVAGGSGGGMFNAQGSLPSINDVTFAYNKARYGGGVYNDILSPTFTNSKFLNNTAELFGGGMYNRKQASPLIISSQFQNNKASIGGGMYNVDGASPEISQSSFVGNEAENGGGLYNYNESSPTLTNVYILNNRATFVGGGMYNYKHTGLAPALNNVVFAGNNAGNGGGMANRSGSSPRVTNAVFYDNRATAAGGGVYNYNRGNPRLRHVTFSDNYAPSGAELYAGGLSNPALTSSVMWNRSTDNVILIQSGGTLTAQSCAIKNLGAYQHAGFGNLDLDPFYVNPGLPAGPDGIFMTADDGLRLSTGSPALNYGVTAGMPETDILGVTRESPPEMGAYEGDYEHVQQPLGIVDTLEGSGDTAAAGDSVTVHYIGTLVSGLEFDNSYTRGAPYTFVLGSGTTITGWDQGIAGMKVGGKRKLTVPPHLAYGNQTVGVIPPNATLLFDIELVSIN